MALRHSRLALTFAVGMAMAFPAAAPAATPIQVPRRPAVGVGDPYLPEAGNPGYNVRHYAISVAFRPADGFLRGDTTLTMTAKVRLTRFNLDLLLPADSVTVGGRAARFSQRRHELTVRPRTAVRAGDVVKVRVRYHGKPAGISYAGARPFTLTRTGAIAVGEPAIAAWWFPSNDHPSDKATFATRLTVPKGAEAVSNGTLVSRTDRRTTSVWRWAMPRPMATYLAFAAFGQYDLESGVTADGLHYVYAFERGLGAQGAAARRSLHQSPAIVRWLAKWWGAYPYKSIGGVVPNVRLGYALENQTRPVYGRDMFSTGAASSLVVHELAHQWFGDRVSLRRWRDIWLNEGFATYAEWMWDAHLGGQTPQQRFRSIYASFEPSSAFWDLRIGDPGRTRLFDSAVYDRGAMTLQALRNRVGMKVFLQIARRWAHSADGVGSTPEFKQLAERISHQQLDGLFAHWLQTGSKPAPTAENGL